MCLNSILNYFLLCAFNVQFSMKFCVSIEMHCVWKKSLPGVNQINHIKIIKTKETLSVFC